MADTEETALYVGEGGNCLSDGTALIPGVTIAMVSKGEAEASELWEPITGVPASPLPRNSPPPVPPAPLSPPPAEAA